MNEWDVRVEVAGDRAFNDEMADGLLDRLASYAPAVSYNGASIAVRLTIGASGMFEAIDIARAALSAAFQNLSPRHMEVAPAPTLAA